MSTEARLNLLIEKATAIAGNQVRLAEALGVPKGHISDMKAGRRPASWKTRAKLRVIAGDSIRDAYLEEAVRDLEESGKKEEQEAAQQLMPMLQMPNDWRKRSLIDRIQCSGFVVRLGAFVNKTLHQRLRNTISLPHALQRI